MIGSIEHSENVTQAQKKMLRLAVELGIKVPGHEPAPTPARLGETEQQREKREAAARAGDERVAAYRARLAHYCERGGAPFQEADVQGFVRQRVKGWKA